MRLILTTTFLFYAVLTFGQISKIEIDKVYDFAPSKLSKSEQDKKMPKLDAFWKKVESDTTTYLPALRRELNEPNHNPYFYFDGTSLLLSLTSRPLDKSIAAKNIAKCQLKDIDRRAYVMLVNKLANEGFNTTYAALKILEDPAFSFFIPQHALNFNQAYCLTYMLLPLKPQMYTQALINSFKKENITSQQSIITALWFGYTCKGDSLINSVISDRSINKKVGEYAKAIISNNNLSKQEKDYSKTAGTNQLTSLRQMALLRFSDEAVEELGFTTKVLRRSTNCR